MAEKISDQIDKLSVRMHRRTGYSLRHAVTEAKKELSDKYPHEFFIYNSDEWEIFLEIVDEACR